MSDFHKAWYITCSKHKDIEHPLWRKCSKCSAVITYTEEEVKLLTLQSFLIGVRNPTESLYKWFELNKKK